MSVQGVSTQVAVAAAISHAHSTNHAAAKRTSWPRASKLAFYAAFYATADEAIGGSIE